MTTWTATIEKTTDAAPMGVYVPTAIDAAKDAADIRIINCGNTYTIRSKVALSGRGIKQPYSAPRTYEVTESALAKLEAAYRVACDF